MKLDRLSIWTGGEDLAQGRIEHILRDTLIDRGARLEMRIDRNQGLRPEALIGVGGIDLRTASGTIVNRWSGGKYRYRERCKT
jgi:hypothetical protein